MRKVTVGIDEAGRGPLAGPVSVGVAVVPDGYDESIFIGIRDSKKLSPKKRKFFFDLLRTEKEKGNLDYAVSMSSAQFIDGEGIVSSITSALTKAITSLKFDMSSLILLDGGLHAGEEYPNQKTIIKGDTTEFSIMLAAVAAKVMRDHLMVTYSEKYPEYFFEQHKGYGTKLHYECIKKYGLCDIHRRSFVKL